MKMMSSTSTTSTSGVMLMDAFSRLGSPSRMGRHLRVRNLRSLGRVDVRFEDSRFWDLEQTVDEVRLGAVHLDVVVLHLPGEVVERDDRRDRNEDTERRRHQGFSDTA